MGGRRDGLRAARKAAGHTLESLAEAVDVDRSTVIRWESGQSEPRPSQRPKLAEALRVSLTQVDVLLLVEALDDAVSRAIGQVLDDLDPQGTGASTRQIDLVEQIRAALRDPRSVDLITVAHLREQIHSLDANYDTSPSSLLVGQAGQCLGHVMLLKGYASGRVAAALSTAEAEAATLVGQLIWDASQRRDHTTANLYFEQARTAARQVHDPATEGHALLRKSIVALYGEHDPATGRDLAIQAVTTGALTSAVIAGLSQLHVAEAHAMLGERYPCERALDDAQTRLADITVDDPARELFTGTQPGRMAGSCYLVLGEPRRAQRTLEDTARGFKEPSKNQAIVWGNLGLAHLRQSDIEAAVAALHKAIDIVEATRGGGGLNVVFDAGRELRPWAALAAVRDLHDRLWTLMTAPG